VRVRVIACGVATAISRREGCQLPSRPQPAGRTGHEIIGVVDAIGAWRDGVEGREGLDRLLGGPLGECAQCGGAMS